VAKLKTKTDFSLTEELSLEISKESSKNANPPTPKTENANNPSKVPKQLAKVCLKNCPIGFHLLLIILFSIVGIPRPETSFLFANKCTETLGDSDWSCEVSFQLPVTSYQWLSLVVGSLKSARFEFSSP
jgi:hypothetical protein